VTTKPETNAAKHRRMIQLDSQGKDAEAKALARQLLDSPTATRDQKKAAAHTYHRPKLKDSDDIPDVDPEIIKRMNRSESLLTRMANEELDPRFFSDKLDLDPAVRTALLSVADDVKRSLRDQGVELNAETVVLTGSETGGDYDDHSDLDLHFLVDFDKHPKMMASFLAAHAKVYNNRGMRLRGRPVEVYFQSASEPHLSPGVYDLVKGTWLKAPSEEEQTRSAPSHGAKELARMYLEQASLLKAELDVSAPGDKDAARGALTRATEMMAGIKAMRSAGLHSGGLRSDGNTTFRLLRRNGAFEKLNAVVKVARDRLLDA